MGTFYYFCWYFDSRTRAINTPKSLPPVHFQPGFNTFQNHWLHATHQGEKFFSDYSIFLSDTGVFCWHTDDLWLGIKTRPVPLQLLDHVILDLFYFFLRNLVPFVAHEQSTLGCDWFFLCRKRYLPYLSQQFSKLQIKIDMTKLACTFFSLEFYACLICYKKLCCCARSINIADQGNSELQGSRWKYSKNLGSWSVCLRVWRESDLHVLELRRVFGTVLEEIQWGSALIRLLFLSSEAPFTVYVPIWERHSIAINTQ